LITKKYDRDFGMVGTKMEFNSISDVKKATVLEKLKSLNSTDRMLLLNKYSRQAENIYCTFRAEENIDIITKIFTLKFNKDALVDAYVNGDPIVDHPGCRLNDFLDNEFLH
jgi:hypothetical protein